MSDADASVQAQNSDALISRIRETIGKESTRSFANRAGISDGTLRSILKGARPIIDNIVAIAKAGNVSVEWLATGEGRKERLSEAEIERLRRMGLTVTYDAMMGIAQGAAVEGKPGLAALRREIEAIGNGFVMIPRFDVEASAGPGALTDEENVIDHMAFKESWVRRTLRADPRKLALITAVGDSMEPTIRAGDLLLVDTGVNEVIDDAIYVIAMDGHLMVKRLQRFFGGAVVVKSDNPTYIEQTLGPDEAGYAKVAGRVRWIARLI